MKQEEFIKLIESIGFKSTNNFNYYYKEYSIYLYGDHYNFYNSSEGLYYIPYNDLKPILKLTRSVKLKALLR